MCKMHTCTPLLLEGKKSQHPLYQDSTTAATVLHHIHRHKHKIVGHCSKSPGYVWHAPTDDVVRSHPQASDSPSDTQHKIQSMHRPSACSQPMSTIPLYKPIDTYLGFHHVFHQVLQPFLNHLPPSLGTKSATENRLWSFSDIELSSGFKEGMFPQLLLLLYQFQSPKPHNI